MTKDTIKVHETFVASILANDDHWKELLAETIYLKGPLAEIEGKEDFITLNAPYFEAIQDIEVHQSIVTETGLATRITTTIGQEEEKPLSYGASEWYDIQEGKIQALYVYFDPKPLM